MLDISYSTVLSYKGDWHTYWTGIFNYSNNKKDDITFLFDKVYQLANTNPNLFETLRDAVEESKLESILLELVDIEKESDKKITEAMLNIKITGVVGQLKEVL